MEFPDRICLCVGIQEISDDVYQGVDHSDSDDSDKSDSSDSEYASEEEQGRKDNNHDTSVHKESKKRPRPPPSQPQDIKMLPSATVDKTTSKSPSKMKPSTVEEKESQEKPKATQQQPPQREKASVRQDGKTTRDQYVDSDSERELVIDLGEEQGGRDRKKPKRESLPAPSSATKDPAAVKSEGGHFRLLNILQLLLSLAIPGISKCFHKCSSCERFA